MDSSLFLHENVFVQSKDVHFSRSAFVERFSLSSLTDAIDVERKRRRFECIKQRRLFGNVEQRIRKRFSSSISSHRRSFSLVEMNIIEKIWLFILAIQLSLFAQENNNKTKERSMRTATKSEWMRTDWRVRTVGFLQSIPIDRMNRYDVFSGWSSRVISAQQAAMMGKFPSVCQRTMTKNLQLHNRPLYFVVRFELRFSLFFVLLRSGENFESNEWDKSARNLLVYLS